MRPSSCAICADLRVDLVPDDIDGAIRWTCSECRSTVTPPKVSPVQASDDVYRAVSILGECTAEEICDYTGAGVAGRRRIYSSLVRLRDSGRIVKVGGEGKLPTYVAVDVDELTELSA